MMKTKKILQDIRNEKVKVLNAALKNENFRQRLVTRIAKNLGDD